LIFDHCDKEFRFKTIANQLFSDQRPMMFKEATAERNWIRQATFNTGIHVTLSLWQRVLLAALTMDQPNKASTPHLLLINRINLIRDRMDSYLNEGGKEEQEECQKLLEEQHERKYGKNKTDSYSPWPFYLIGSPYLGPHCHHCG
jgi:hypothetical protein